MSKDELDDMFEGADVSDDDLLDSVEEDNAQAWMPSHDGDGIVGVVTVIGRQRSDFAQDGEDPYRPAITIRSSDGEEWRIVCFATVLKDRIMQLDPPLAVGDILAVKFHGERVLRTGKFKGRNFKNYGVARRRPASVRG
jgi:hypothetical protein